MFVKVFKVTMVFGKAYVDSVTLCTSVLCGVIELRFICNALCSYALMKILSDPLHFIANLPERKRTVDGKRDIRSGIPDPSSLEKQKTIAEEMIQSSTVLNEELQIVTPQFLTVARL